MKTFRLVALALVCLVAWPSVSHITDRFWPAPSRDAMRIAELEGQWRRQLAYAGRLRDSLEMVTAELEKTRDHDALLRRQVRVVAPGRVSIERPGAPQLPELVDVPLLVTERLEAADAHIAKVELALDLAVRRGSALEARALAAEELLELERAARPGRIRALWEKVDGPVMFVAGAVVVTYAGALAR